MINNMHPKTTSVKTSVVYRVRLHWDSKVNSFRRCTLMMMPVRVIYMHIFLWLLQGLFKLPQSVGVLGGRPNHAVWLIGCVGDNIICLDPHTTQPARRLGQPSPGSDNSSSLDGSYHCTTPVSLPFARLDPSLAVGFICSSEKQFDDLCKDLRADVLSDQFSPPIFEIHETRPHNLPPPFSTYVDDCAAGLQAPEEWSDLYLNTPNSPLNKKCTGKQLLILGVLKQCACKWNVAQAIACCAELHVIFFFLTWSSWKSPKMPATWEYKSHLTIASRAFIRLCRSALFLSAKKHGILKGPSKSITF